MVNRFKEIRKSVCLNQTDFGKEIGVSRDVIANIEGGRIEPKDIHILSVCRRFSVSEAWLRFGIGDMHELKESSDFLELAQDLDLSADQYDIEIQEIAADLIRTWAELTPEYKRVILEVAHRFRDKKKKDR